MKPLSHLISAEELETEQIQHILDLARKMSKAEVPIFLRGKTVVNLFFENSTRTRLSFELAIRRLGGAALNFSSTGSSLSKGETLIDTVRNLEAMQASVLVVRHQSAGSPLFLTRHSKLPVVNAGDGFHEHPTQALLDLLTIEERLKAGVSGKTIVILGDIAHSRVARSNIHILRKRGARVIVCGPPTLLPPNPEALGVRAETRIENVLPEADVVMALRVQLERQNRMQIPSLAEYARIWGLNRERARLLKPTALILHPGPVNRGVEIDPEVADGSHSVILDQVANGVLIRMSVLATLVAPQEVGQWLRS